MPQHIASLSRSPLYLPAAALALAAGCHSLEGAIAATVLAVLIWLWAPGWKSAASSALLIASTGLGFFSSAVLPAPLRSPIEHWALLEIDSPPVQGRYNHRFTGHAQTRANGAMRSGIFSSKDSLFPGQRYLALLRWRPFKAAAALGDFDEQRVYVPKGHAGRASVVRALHLPRDNSPVRSWAAQWNAAVVAHLRKRLATVQGSPGSKGLVLGILTGDKRDLPPVTKSTFSSAGLSHLLAVSGFHVGLVGGMALWLFTRFTNRAKHAPVRFSWLLPALACWAYIFACGAPNSAVRAGLMGSLAGVGLMVGRRPYAMALLGAGAWILLLRSPAAVHDLGTQCSFTATAAILFLVESPALEKKSRRNIRALFGIPIVAQWATAPIILPVFLSMPVVFLPANLLASPWVMVAVCGALLSAVLPPLVAEPVMWAVLQWVDLGIRAVDWAVECAPALALPRSSARTVGLLWASAAAMMYVLRTKKGRITCLGVGLLWLVSMDFDGMSAVLERVPQYPFDISVPSVHTRDG